MAYVVVVHKQEGTVDRVQGRYASGLARLIDLDRFMKWIDRSMRPYFSSEDQRMAA